MAALHPCAESPWRPRSAWGQTGRLCAQVRRLSRQHETQLDLGLPLLARCEGDGRVDQQRQARNDANGRLQLLVEPAELGLGGRRAEDLIHAYERWSADPRDE